MFDCLIGVHNGARGVRQGPQPRGPHSAHSIDTSGSQYSHCASPEPTSVAPHGPLSIHTLLATFHPARAAQLRYCDKFVGPSPARTQYDCEFQDAVDIFPITERSFMVTTRVKEQAQTRTCDEHAISCRTLFAKNSSRTYFIADVESYTLLMDHTAQASVIDVHGE